MTDWRPRYPFGAPVRHVETGEYGRIATVTQSAGGPHFYRVRFDSHTRNCTADELTSTLLDTAPSEMEG